MSSTTTTNSDGRPLKHGETETKKGKYILVKCGDSFVSRMWGDVWDVFQIKGLLSFTMVRLDRIPLCAPFTFNTEQEAFAFIQQRDEVIKKRKIEIKLKKKARSENRKLLMGVKELNKNAKLVKLTVDNLAHYDDAALKEFEQTLARVNKVLQEGLDNIKKSPVKQKKRKADAKSDAKSEQIKKQKRSIVPVKNAVVTVNGYEGMFLVSQVQQEVRVKLFRTEHPYATIFKNVEHIKSIVKHPRIPKKGDTVRFYRSQGSQSNFGVGVVKEECLGYVDLQLKGDKRGWCLSHNSSYYILDEVVAGSKNL